MDKPSLIIALKSKAKEGMDGFNSDDSKDVEMGDKKGKGYDQELHDKLMEFVQEICAGQGSERLQAIKELEDALDEVKEEASESPDEEKAEDASGEEATEEESHR